MRKDLGMRKGKMIAQGAHAAMAWLKQRIKMEYYDHGDPRVSGADADGIHFSAAEATWLLDGHTKICLQVNSEAELVAIYDQAKAAGLEVHMIEDVGATEFHGVKTKTCLAIGPDDAERIDAVTRNLSLY